MSHDTGLLPEGLARQWDEDGTSNLIQTTPFDFDRIDTLESVARDALTVPEAFPAFVVRLRHSIERRCQAELLLCLLGILDKFKNKSLAIDCLKYVGGIAALEGMDMPRIAEKHGVSKEAVHQCSMKVRTLLKIRRTRTMRDDSARENMKLRNYRRVS